MDLDVPAGDCLVGVGEAADKVGFRIKGGGVALAPATGNLAWCTATATSRKNGSSTFEGVTDNATGGAEVLGRGNEVSVAAVTLAPATPWVVTLAGQGTVVFRHHA